MSTSKLNQLIDRFLQLYYTDRPNAIRTYYTDGFQLTVTHKLDYRPGMIEDMKWKFEFRLNSNVVQIASFETFLGPKNNRTMLINKLQTELFNRYIQICKSMSN